MIDYNEYIIYFPKGILMKTTNYVKTILVSTILATSMIWSGIASAKAFLSLKVCLDTTQLRVDSVASNPVFSNMRAVLGAKGWTSQQTSVTAVNCASGGYALFTIDDTNDDFKTTLTGRAAVVGDTFSVATGLFGPKMSSGSQCVIAVSQPNVTFKIDNINTSTGYRYLSASVKFVLVKMTDSDTMTCTVVPR